MQTCGPTVAQHTIQKAYRYDIRTPYVFTSYTHNHIQFNIQYWATDNSGRYKNINRRHTETYRDDQTGL